MTSFTLNYLPESPSPNTAYESERRGQKYAVRNRHFGLTLLDHPFWGDPAAMSRSLWRG